MTASAPLQILPEGVRRHIAELAATVLGELSGPEIPSPLVRVRAFAPARRARAGAGPLAATLDRDPAFRQRVASAWRALHPDLAEAIDGGSVPGAVEPDLALVGVYLLRPPDWPDLARTLTVAVERAAQAASEQQSDVAVRAELKAAREESDRLRDLLDAERARTGELEEQLTGVRRELRKLRSDADRARAQARTADERAEAERARSAARTAELEQSVQQATEAVRQATERAEQSRRAGREGRSLADARVRLLLDTVVDAAAGLRRELALPPTDLRPADLVSSTAPTQVDALGAAPSTRGEAVDDPALLSRLLALPQPHLVVDGYNVTKTGYGTLPLVEQRRRLVDSLAGLAARTSAEVTCCFDGAEVEGSPATRVRGVRVLFSDPGMTADELVRRLVRAEPPGRVVVVVSTDGEVMRGVRAAGAHAVPSQALLRLLARG
jgi:predicted RNA-binding protein with PIN domain